MFRQEWEFWNRDAPDLSAVQITDELRKLFIDLAHAKLRPLRDQIELIDNDTEVRPGIFARFAGGHTPGHMIVQIKSGADQLYFVSDLVLHPLAFERPAWHTRYECDVATAQAVQRWFFDEIVHEAALVHVMHFPYPGLGRIVAVGDHWRWQPLASVE